MGLLSEFVIRQIRDSAFHLAPEIDLQRSQDSFVLQEQQAKLP